MSKLEQIESELLALHSDIAASQPIYINPPCSIKNKDGSISHFVWECSLSPDIFHESTRLMEILETPSGRVGYFESDFTRPADLVI